MEKEQSSPVGEAQQAEQLESLPPEEAQEVEVMGAVAAEDEQPTLGKMKIDLHCHTEASPDSSTPLELIPPRCDERAVRVQAITDHNAIWGAQKLKEMVEQQADTHLTVIVGEEISTQEGEIIGLFLDEPIAAGLSAEETVQRIKAQNGLVLVPHGFDPMKRHRLHPKALVRIAADIDIVETFNARVSSPIYNQHAVAWSQEHGVLMSAGSDAHTLADIGSAWVEAPWRSIRQPDDLLKALDGSKPVGVWTHPVLAFLYKVWDRTRRRIKSWF